MKFFEGFLHLNIRCSQEDLPAIEKFYGDVLGLKTGYRPNFTFGGIWLYDGDDPIIHVGARFPKGSFVKDKHSGSVDHIAFKASGQPLYEARARTDGITAGGPQVIAAMFSAALKDFPKVQNEPHAVDIQFP